MLMAAVSILEGVIWSMTLVMTALVLVCLSWIVLGKVHLHLESLMGLASIQHRMLALVVTLAKHGECWGIGAGRSIWGGCIVVGETYSLTRPGRACPLVYLSRMMEGLLVLPLIVMLSGSCEPVSTICHLLAAAKKREGLYRNPM